jgi:diguanylate cyclase (GGDEF)-like protein/PAS domain S-box-containing protein
MDQSNCDFEKLRLENEHLKERLLKIEQKYRTLFEENPIMYFTVDAQGTIMSVNSFGANQLGYTVGELLGKSVLMVFHPEDHERVIDQLEKCLQGPGKLYQWDLRKIRKDKTVLWVKEFARMFKVDDEEQVVMIVCQDITENKRVEESLKTAYDGLETRVREKTSDLVRANESLQDEIRERERKEAELKIIGSMTEAMNQSIDLEDVFRIALDRVLEQGYVDIACIYLVDHVKNEAVLRDHRGFPDDFLRRASRIPYPKGVTWKVINSGEILNVRNASEDADVGPAGRDLGFRSMLGIPITLEGSVIGVIWLLSYAEHVFTKPEVELLVSIGSQIAIAVARANLYRDLSRKNQYETIIATVTTSIHKSIDIQEVLENSVDAMSTYIDVVDHVSIYLVEGDEAVMRAYRGHPDWFVKKVKRIPHPKGFTWKTIIDGKPIHCEDVDKDDVIGPAGKEVGTKSYASMPLVCQGKTVGSINVHSFTKFAFDDEDLRLLETVSAQIGVAISHANQAEDLKHSEQALLENLDQLSKKNRYETIISTVTRIVHRSINLQEVLENAVEALNENIHGCHNVSIYVVEGQEAVMKANRGYPEWFIRRVGRIPYPRGFTWRTIIEEKPLYVANAEKDSVIGPAGLEVGTKSYASMPIRYEDKTIGCININSLELDAFDEEELRLLDSVAKQIETAVNNARQAEALRQSEERYRILFDQSPLGVFIIDRELKITRCNEQLVRIFKSSQDKIIGLEIDKLRDRSFYPILRGALEGQTNNHETFYKPTTSDAKLWLSATASPLCDSDGKVVGALGVVEDITQRKQIEQDLRDSKERLSYIFDNTPNVAIESFDEHGKVLYWNNAAEKVFGFSKDQALGKTLDQLILDKESMEKFNLIMKEVIKENKPSLPTELDFISGSGIKGTVYSTIFPIPSSGTNAEFICMNVDITERKTQEEKIHHMAMHDYLTELPNRRALQRTLDRLPENYGTNKNHAFVVMDIDNFKLINDTVGHLEGDQVLVDLADALRSAMRPSDLLARVGGDEFAMVIHDVSPSQAKSVSERFFNIINGRSYYLKGFRYQINLSIGIRVFDSKSDSKMVMASAYSALSDAKFEGKNRIIVHNIKDGGEVDPNQAARWGIRINDALRANRLVIHYQPVMSLVDEAPLYDEVLVRIVDGNNNMIYPKAFIPSAERFGLMTKIDRWVVERVIDAIGEEDGFRTFINLSGSSLRDESLLGFIENCLTESKVISNRIGFEITEFATITDINRIRNWMIKLKKLGCQFALDDFGIGHSSFSHLLDLPVDFVKVEGSFVQGLDTNPASIAIVKSIISVSHLMKKEVIAEGIETQPVIAFLRRLKVQYGQGNYLKPPTEDRTFIPQRKKLGRQN